MMGALETVIRKPIRHLMRARPGSVPLSAKQPTDHTQQLSGNSRVSVLSGLLRSIRRSQTHLLSRLRRWRRKPLFQPKNRVSIQIARAETKTLLRLLHEANIPDKTISQDAP